MRIDAVLIVFIVIQMLFLSPDFVNAKIYKWKDSRGVTHFTEDPPPSGAQSLSTMESVNTSTSTNFRSLPANHGELASKLDSIELQPGQIE
jgi:hypothetical protein